MTSTAAAPPRKNRSTLAVTAGIVAALLVAFFIFAGLYADVLWYDQLGFQSVLFTQWGSVAALFAIGFLTMAVPVFVSLFLAYRFRPVYARSAAQIDRYQQVIDPLRRLAVIGIPLVIGLFAGVSASTRWQAALLYLNRTPSGTTDPQFGIDISFYLFDLPFLRGVVGFLSAVVIIAGILTIATHYLYGALGVNGRDLRITKAARIQIAVTAAIYVLLQAVSIFFDQFATLYEVGSRITGASYTDVNVVIPTRQILAMIAIVVALLFLVAAITGRWRFPVIGTALLVVAALVIGSVAPWVVQRFQVLPSELSLERPYIQRNIDMTREAYGVAGVQEEQYDATTQATAGALRSDAETTANIRILDPAIVSPSFAQLQRFKQYYQFQQDLDVDRYQIGGQTTDAVVAVRELNQAGLGDSQTWYNRTVVYTHGYGLVAAYGNQRSTDGQPVFLESDIPSTGQLGDYEPRVYFGEAAQGYSIVGAPEGTDPIELDYPSNGGEGDGQIRTTFTGNGGPSVGNWFNKLIYALKFQSEQIFLSDAVNQDSQILYDRDPRQRVAKVAPYLTMDSDAYPTVVDGRLKWVVDGYTTASTYPYSKVQSLSEAIADTFTPTPSYVVDNVNYIRNSVKATVDAYDGSVDLYVWDTSDPVIESWQKVFPTSLKPMSEMSADLMSHVRYPQDLFKVQRAILGTYHVTDAGSFYNSDDAWRTPADPTAGSNQDLLQPPYYLTMQVPGSDSPTYSLYSTFIPNNQGANSQSVLTGYLAVDSDAGSTAGQKSDGYGTLRLLELPKDDTVPGPGQVQNTFNSNATVANQLNILQTGGSTDVLRGNLLTLPVGGGLLYVQPVYVQSSGETRLPLLRKVLVAFGDRVAFEDTLDKALDELFQGDSGAGAGDANVPDTPDGTGNGTGGGTGTGTGGTTGGGTGSSTQSPELSQALQAASQALQDRQAAYAANDLVAAAEADQRLQSALQQAIAAGS